jgi:hypothetical protein
VANEEFNRNLKPISLVREHSLGLSRSRVTIMEQGFPPEKIFESVNPAVTVTHSFMLPLILAMGYMVFATVR